MKPLQAHTYPPVHTHTHLILQMKERRAPILILTEDWGLSFFTVPVFRSSIRPERIKTTGRWDLRQTTGLMRGQDCVEWFLFGRWKLI